MTTPVRTVAVLGGGIAAPMAALAIARAYGRLGVAVTWHDSGTATPSHAALLAPPEMARFHRLIGIDDAALVGRAAATISLGQQYAGWGGDGVPPFLVAYGDAGTPYASLPFVQHWARARAAGLQVPLEDFCLAAVAAKQGRVGPVRDPAVRQAVKQGWNLEAAGYAGLLRDGCVAAGVRIVPADGRRPDADLLVDADGGWSEGAMEPVAAPCDRVLRGSTAALDPVPLYARIAAHDAGWTMLAPLADRLAVTCVYDGARMDAAGARAAMAAAAGRPVTVGDAEPVAAAARPAPWHGRTVAIGPAAGVAPPMDGAELLLLQLAIAQLVLLWPIDRAAMPEAAIYNDEMAGSRARIADFAALHLRLGRRAGPFWDAARALPASDVLDAKIALFAARGMFAHFNHEAHVEGAWALALAGHGVVPASFDPQALLVEEQALMAEFQRQLRAIAAEVRGMEPHAMALGRLRR